MILTLENLFTGINPGQLVTLSITNPIWAYLDSNNGFRNDRPVEENIFRGVKNYNKIRFNDFITIKPFFDFKLT